MIHEDQNLLESKNMKLLLKGMKEKLIKNWKASEEAENRGEDLDYKVVVKFFNPTGAGTWYIFEAKPSDPSILYGLCVIHEPEWGYVSLDELKAFRGSMGLPIERDIYYTPISKSELQKRVDEGQALG